MLSEAQIQQLRDSLTISTLLTPSDQGYAESLKRWSDANEKPAAAVLMAENENDIASAIKFATKFHVDLAVRGGGHSHWDASSSDGGLVIDLSNMNKVTVDTDTKTAVVQGGALWMHVDEALGERGLAAVGGTVNHTGVGGLALGGGYGYLSGQHGLTVDNTLRVRMVLADGTIVNASETENTDLFWAVRGAGHNFGVAVEFVFQAYDKPNKVFCGMMLFLAGKAPAIAEFLQEWRTTQQPNETIAMALIVPPHLGGQAAIGLTIFFDGPEDEANSRFAGLIEIGPVANYTGMMPYSNVNSIVAKTEPHGRRKTVKGGMWAPPFKMNNLQPVIDEFTAMHKSYPEFGGSAIILQHDFTGKITSVPNNAMAFPNRGPDNLMLIQIVSDDPKLDGVKREYAHKIMALMHKLSEGRIDDEHGPVIYCNYAMGTESAREVYRHNYERLSSLKAKYDPNNVFCKFIPIEPKPQQAQ